MNIYHGAVFLALGSLLMGRLLRVVALMVVLRGTTHRDRPAIIRALADLFRTQPASLARLAPRQAKSSSVMGDVGWEQDESLRGMGEVLRESGDPDGARAAWRQAVAIFEAVADPAAESLRAMLGEV